MSKKTNKTRILLYAFAGVVLAGFVLLISSQMFSFGGLAFEVLTYMLSVSALVLAILSVIYSIRQRRLMNRMVRDIHAAIFELKEVAESNDKIEKEIREEYRMNKVITDVFSEYGIGDNEKIRTAIAQKVGRRLKKSQ